jgi:tetratricopeptide (TPR) repeat protein
MSGKALKGAEATVTFESVAQRVARAPLRRRSVARTLPDGELIAGRYRIVRFIAEGNWGEVYEAEDLTLREHVALKMLRPELGFRAEILERFKRELCLARRVTHPNVCRVFDLGEHPGGGGPTGAPVSFLTMELLEGPTLQEFVELHGRLPVEDILPLAEQMAAALDAAHAAQVIHRDFKGGNVVLVPTAAVAHGLRAVVTDFGLALGASSGQEFSVSQETLFAGTPVYMSPEQVEGHALSPASDLYSFGVVLYELVTGRWPFIADTAAAIALKRLQGPPPPPSTWVPELEPHWDAVLMRCLARAPKDRFATAADIIQALRGSRLPAEPGPSAALAPGASPRTRPALAVLAPRSLWARPEVAWLSTALAELLYAELAASGRVRLISGEEVARMRRELSLPEEDSFSRETLARMRAHSGADLILTGTYLALGQAGASTLRLDLRLHEATGELVTQLTETGPEQELLGLLSRVGTALRKHLGLAPLTTEQTRWVRSAMPASNEVARLYAEGLAALRSHDAALAVERLERVVAQEPNFALAHSALAAACSGLFLAERAKASARRAFELSPGLPHEERLLVEARHHEAEADWAQAIEAYRSLVALCPDSVEYGTALVSAYVSAGQPREAQQTILALRRLPVPLGEDARIDLVEANALAAASDFEGCLRQAELVVDKARSAGQWLLVATALLLKASAVRNLGDPERAIELMQEAERLFLVGSDRGGAIRSMLGRAIALFDLMRLREAGSVLTTVLELTQSYRGSLVEAEGLGIRGWLACHLGNAFEALRLTREALALFQALEMPLEQTHYSIQLAMVRHRQGALDEAQRLFEEGTAMAQRIGDDYTEAWAQQELGALFIDRGDWAQARARLGRALELRKARGLEAFVIETELALAKLALKEGASEQSLALASRAYAFYVRQKNRDKEGLAHAVLARALLVRGRHAEARQELVRARALAGRSEDVFITAEVLLTEAWVTALLGAAPERQELAQRLQELIDWAHQGGLVGVVLQARLCLAELEQASGMVEPVRAECSAIEQEALRLGYLAIARKAGAVARR